MAARCATNVDHWTVAGDCLPQGFGGVDGTASLEEQGHAACVMDGEFGLDPIPELLPWLP
jgi:hypothetical protein